MTDNEKYLYLINKFVEKPGNWGMEKRMAKAILKNWPRFDYWQFKQEKKFGSLACLLTENAKSFISKTYTEYVLENPEVKIYNLEDKPVGENIEIIHKPKSLMEFMGKSHD